MIKYEITKLNDRNIFHIKWVNDSMDVRVYERMVKLFKKSSDYGYLNKSKTNALKDILMKINREFNTNVTMDQVISLRNIVIKDKIIKNYSRMNHMINKIAIEYGAGRDIITLSVMYDFPPLNLLRGILIHKGINVAKLYDLFANKVTPKGILHGRDLQQYKLAESNDAESTFNQKKVAETAAINENKFVEFFKSLGIKLLTQDDLVNEQMEKYGRAVITPDLLFIDEVYINDVRVHWIDYKDYIGTMIHFLFKSNSGQATKYNEKWGTGALCYHKGYVQGLIIPGALLLDARSLSIKFRE